MVSFCVFSWSLVILVGPKGQSDVNFEFPISVFVNGPSMLCGWWTRLHYIIWVKKRVIIYWNEKKIIVTARMPKEWGRYCFHRCLSVHSQWRLPDLPELDGVPDLYQDWMGVLPLSALDGGTPLPRQGLKGIWAGYAANGMPHAVFRRRTFL